MEKRIEELDENLLVPETNEGLAWYDVLQWGVEGKGWCDTAAPFDRLPGRAEGLVPDPVWQLSLHSAGLSLRFITNATHIAARWRLRFDQLAMPHMPATGVSGLDLYGRNDEGQWRRAGVGVPAEFPEVQTQLTNELDGESREYLVYLPLYNGVERVEIGVPQETSFAGVAPRKDRPIVFYGTSITQGGCASRPGMAYPAILDRWLDCPAINLGFSGNGKMDPEMADLLAELDPRVYVIDCLPNMTAELVEERAESFVTTLHNAHPKTPIILAEDRTHPMAAFQPAQALRNQTSRAALAKAVDNLRSTGIDSLRYLEGEEQLGTDREDTVDGSHPTDLGFWRMAKAFHRVLNDIT